MKNIINSFSKELMEKENFNIPKDINNNLIINDDYCLLLKTGLDSSCIVEIYDAGSIIKNDMYTKFETIPDQATDLDLLNIEEIFRVKLFVFENISSELSKEIEYYYNNKPDYIKYDALIVFNLETKEIILNKGIIYPYENICNVCDKCLKSYNNEIDNSTPDFEGIMQKKFEEKAASYEFDLSESPVTLYSGIAFSIILLACTAIFSFAGSFSAVSKGGISISPASIGLLIMFFTITIFNFFNIGKVIEGNYGSLKFMLITLCSCIPVSLTIGFFPSLLMIFWAPCGSLIYILFNMPKKASISKIPVYSLLFNIALIVISGFTFGFQYMISGGISLTFSFLLSGCFSFELEKANYTKKNAYIAFTAFGFIIFTILSFML